MAQLMTAPNNNFDRLIQSIDRIDTIRSQSAQIEQAMGAADRDKALVEKLMTTYQEQGIALDRSVVEKAVAQTLPTRACHSGTKPHRFSFPGEGMDQANGLDQAPVFG